jgi:predicted ester cyclase
VPTPQQSLEAAYEGWNAGSLDRYLELYDDEIRLHGYSPEPMNKGEVKGFYEMIFRAFDSPKLSFHETLWDGDSCAIRFTMTGRHVAEFIGVPATGTEIVLPGNHDPAVSRRARDRAVLPSRHAGPARADRRRASTRMTAASGGAASRATRVRSWRR